MVQGGASQPGKVQNKGEEEEDSETHQHDFVWEPSGGENPYDQGPAGGVENPPPGLEALGL